MKRTIVQVLKPYQKGFTLMELLVYMGVLSILIFSLSSIFTSIIDVKLESESTSSADQDNQYILARLAYDMNQATAIVSPASAGQTASSLQITVNATNYTYSLDSNGNLILTIPGVGANQLNSANSKLTSLSFTRVGNGTSSDTIDVQYTIRSQTARLNGKFETRIVETVLGLP